jgi:hypothetical protein
LATIVAIASVPFPKLKNDSPAIASTRPKGTHCQRDLGESGQRMSGRRGAERSQQQRQGDQRGHDDQKQHQLREHLNPV